MEDRYTEAHLIDQMSSLEGVKPTLTTLPSELRAIILRHVLGDRSVHVYYKLELQYENGDIKAKPDATRDIPEYSFCRCENQVTHPSSLQPPESHSLYNSHHGLSYFDSACYDQQTQLIQDTKKKAEGTLSESEFWPLSKVNPRTTRFSNTLFDLQVSSLMICKQLREEALDTFHKTNTFSFGNAIWFNLFASRITNARALLLRKAEFYSDVEWCSGGWATWKWDASYSSLDLQPNNALSKFANLRKIHIEACDSEADDYGWYWEFVKSEREAMMEERLQREFGSLSQLKRIESITVVPRFNMVHHFFNDDNVSNYRMADIPMRGIGDRFANKLMDHCVDMQEIKESA